MVRRPLGVVAQIVKALNWFVLTWFVLQVSPVVVHAKEFPAYRWQRDLTLPKIESTSLVSVPLESDFYEATRDNWPDVRLRNANGASVAFVLRRSQVLKTQTVRQNWIAHQVSARVDASVGVQIVLDVDVKQTVPKGLRIVTPLRDFEHQVQVETSAEGETWKSAGPATLIFDYSQHVDARNVHVPIENPDNHRHFRITVADVTADQESQLVDLHRRLRGNSEVDRTETTSVDRRPFRIDRVEFYRDDATTESPTPQSMPYPTHSLEVATDDENHATIISFQTRREPIQEIKVLTNAENFSRSVRVEAQTLDPANQPYWQTLSTGNLSRFAVGTIQQEELTVSIAETRARHYRLVIENRDSPPLSISGVSLLGPRYELAFLASPNQQLTLEYGSVTARAGDYDTAALEAALANPSESIRQAAWQPPRENPSVPLTPSPRWRPWNDRRILIGGILALTLILGQCLLRASRALTVSPPTENGEPDSHRDVS